MRWIVICCLLIAGGVAFAVEPTILFNPFGFPYEAPVEQLAESPTESEAPDALPVFEGQAQMPERFINQQVRDLKVGETGLVYAGSIRVDIHHYVWIDPEDAITDKYRSLFIKIKVTKLEDGCAITLPHDCDNKWTTTMTGKQYLSMDYLAVMKITVEDE